MKPMSTEEIDRLIQQHQREAMEWEMKRARWELHQRLTQQQFELAVTLYAESMRALWYAALSPTPDSAADSKP